MDNDEREEKDWRDIPEDELAEAVQIEEYDLSSVPNDFNILTIYNFLESGAVQIPGFQRNYVWDMGRASRLIESLILGLPVPQVFLYEAGHNRFLVVDGQQRLMSIYFFMTGRFPKPKKRGELRAVLSGSGAIPDEVLHDDDLFTNFRLRLPMLPDGSKNRFARLSYSTLGEYQTQFELRTIRNIIVKQLKPSGDDSSIYEMFHRLNSGGVNLRPQEIRASLYYSPFSEMLADVNQSAAWRGVVRIPDPDSRLRDTEILLRASAMYIEGQNYSSSMTKFLNSFSKNAMDFTNAEVAEMQQRLEWFITAVASMERSDLFRTGGGRFSVTGFEAGFSAACRLHESDAGYLPRAERLELLGSDEEMIGFAAAGSSHKSKVAGRLKRAYELLAD